jgi:hypothetical protein
MPSPKQETGGGGLVGRRSSLSVSEIRGLPHLNLDINGGRRSLGILSDLVTEVVRGIGRVRASRAVGELLWQPAQAYGIERDDTRDVWHAGHVEAVLTNGHSVIAGAQTGGVWLLTPTPRPTFLAGHTGTCLSDSWDQPAVTSLAFGPDGPVQVIAGFAGGQALFSLEFEIVSGAMIFKRNTTLALPVSGYVYAIVTLANPRCVIIAGTQGVWWSPVPANASDVAGYFWKPGRQLPPAEFSGLALGSGPSVTAAVFPQPPDPKTPPTESGFYRGVFQDGELVFAKATLAGTDPLLMRRTSLASCEDQRDRMYAVAAAADNTLLAVLSSSDGGKTWATRATPNSAPQLGGAQGQAGLQGFYNNSIAGSPTNPNLVVVGWLSGGPLFSDDGGVSWRHPHTQETNRSLHNDLHSVQLVRNASGVEILYVSGDGGIAITRDLGQTYDSQFNRPLRNLQFYGNAITASSRYPGLLAGGTQDNGNVYRRPDTLGAGVPRQADSAWRRQVGGDGGICRFIDPLGVLLNNDNLNPNLRMAVWDEVKQRFPEDAPGTVVPASDNAGGVIPTSLETIVSPSFVRNGQVMYAALASTPTTAGATAGAIYGFFADRPAANAKPGAVNASLIRLGALGETVTAIASTGGQKMLLGTPSGRIVSFDSATGQATDYELPLDRAGQVNRLQSIGARAYALVGDQILRFDGTAWVSTTGGGWNAFIADAESGRIFASTDADVFVSSDRGGNWLDASKGLPARPRCNDLRIADDGEGGRDLYLGTYGRSVWRATIAVNVDDSLGEVPEIAVEILLGIIEDGGGVFRVGNTLHRLPPPGPILRGLLIISALITSVATRVLRFVLRPFR